MDARIISALIIAAGLIIGGFLIGSRYSVSSPGSTTSAYVVHGLTGKVTFCVSFDCRPLREK